jgi:transposase
VAVAIEVPHGPVVDALLDRGFAVHAINPKQLDRLRDRFSVAGAKNDRRDARVAAAGLRTDPHLFRHVQIGDPIVIELREWSRLAAELQQERVRLGNRIRQQLWRYYPQLLALTDDVAAEWMLELWMIAPTPTKAARPRGQRWRACSRSIGSARSMPKPRLASCVRQFSTWPRV